MPVNCALGEGQASALSVAYPSDVALIPLSEL